jgi:hypothetical protein
MRDHRHHTTTHEDPEISPLIGAVPVEGPPAILVAIPWLLVVLLLAGPFALLATIVVAMLVAALIVAALVAIVASPFLLVRHLRSVRERHAAEREHAEPLPAKEPAVAGHRPISLPGY